MLSILAVLPGGVSLLAAAVCLSSPRGGVEYFEAKELETWQ